MLTIGLWMCVTGGLGPTPVTLRDDRTELYRWFDSLDYGAVTKGKFIRIQRKDDIRPTTFEWGFLEQQEGKGFTYLTVGLRRVRVADPPNKYDEKQWFADDIVRWATEQVPIMDSMKEEDYSRSPDQNPLDRHEAFVLARALDARGLHQLADEVTEASNRLYRLWQGGDVKPCETAVKEGVAWQAWWEFLDCTDDVTVPRSEVLARLKTFIRRYPDGPQIKDATDAANTYAAMVQEDNARALSRVVPLWALPIQERVAGMIYRLRDAHAEARVMKSQPNFLSSWFGNDEKVKTVAQQLADLGFEAVPQLIEALGDKRFVRARVGPGLLGFPILRIREAALQVLESIANKQLRGEAPAYVDGVRFDEDKWFAAHQKVARSWWNEIQLKGERQTLIDAALKGDIQQARRLAVAYPADATTVIRETLRHTTEFSVRWLLMDALGDVNTPEAFAFARDTMLNGKDMTARVSAALVVAKHKPQDALAAMIREWKTASKAKVVEGPVEALVSFLVKSGRRDAIDTIANGLSTCEPDLRASVVRQLCTDSFPKKPADARIGESKSPTSPKESVDFLEAVQGLLVSLLPSTATIEGFYSLGAISQVEADFSNPTVRDLAMYALALSWPDRYRYRKATSDLEKKDLAAEFASVWRKEHGK